MRKLRIICMCLLVVCALAGCDKAGSVTATDTLNQTMESTVQATPAPTQSIIVTTPAPNKVENGIELKEEEKPILDSYYQGSMSIQEQKEIESIIDKIRELTGE